jgi:hypothetical protein
MKNMENLGKLKIGLIEPNKKNAQWIKDSFEWQKHVESVEIIQNEEELFNKINDNFIDTLVINIFNDNVSKGIDIIEKIKSKKIPIPVCILGTDLQIKYFKEIPGGRERFKTYCKLVFYASEHDLNEEVERMSKSLSRCKKEMIFGKEWKEIKADNNILNEEKVQKLLKLSRNAIDLAADQGKDANKSNDFIPGVSGKNMKELINKTLKESSESINLYKWVNFGIIIFGVVFILSSFIGFWIKNDLGFLGLGGLGLAGVIASLITAPVASIGKTARQMIQIQTCYLSYLQQIKILKDDTSGDIMKQSKRLEEVTNSLQESLCKYFDADSMKAYESQMALQKVICEHIDSAKNPKEKTNEDEVN